MTWSITAPVLRGGNPIIRWSGQLLRALSDAAFDDAVRAAQALGDDVVSEAAANGPGCPQASMANEAATIIAGIVIEMDRRGVDGVSETRCEANDSEADETGERDDDDTAS